MSAHFASSWGDIPPDLLPTAPMIGPFAGAAFLETWSSDYAPREAMTPIAVSTTAAIPLWIDQGTVRLQGEADLTDYHAPLGQSIDECVALVAERFSGQAFSFDSLPDEALRPFVSALASAGIVATTRHQGAALVIDLPGEPGEWLDSLPKKHRHEIRRKRRRFVDVVGEPVVERRTDEAAFDAFVTMHRSAAGEKGGFMTERMEGFFAALTANAGAAIDLLTVDGRPMAAAFGFTENSAYYLYNSAYAGDLAETSPGIVLLQSMIERSIADGLARFDFLKGDEPYKYRLGAVDRPLSVIEGVFP